MKFTVQKRNPRSSDFSFHKSYRLGSAPLPSELIFLSPIINQGLQDACTAFAAVAARYNETNQTLDPNVFYAQEQSFSGSDGSQGFTIEVPAACAVEKGFPGYQPSCYFWVTAGGGQDLFDNCRQAIFINQRPLIGGLTWMDEYTSAPQGIITQGTTVSGGHCIKIAGWKTINGVLYMVLQNSWGTGVGDNGLFYMPREIFNSAFQPFGVFFWSDDTNPTVKVLGLITAIYQNIISLLTKGTGEGVYPPAQPLIPQLCDGIFAAEGGEKAFGYHINNPGDIKNFTGNKYVASLGATGTVEGFAQFPDMAVGIKACQQLCTDVANGLLKGYPKDCDIETFCNIYAQPPNDNYMNTVLTFLPGKIASTQLSELL